ncbi:ABC transporter substrate-binding protein [Azospirillum sp.]|uniref:ABC transporter substrate-binding protein n=1 Tax=Azospirillum sp. TaxID=34012 RepID=UPI0026027D5B|nr:ABC transporter substrate-binding protein [Azospirillum sp.]
MRRLLPCLIACLALALTPAASAKDVASRTLRVVSPLEIGGIDPARSGYIFTRMGVAETLVGADAQGRPLPALAESWRVSDDGLTWRFTLRRNAVFHDGGPVTGALVVRSLERARTAPGILSVVPITAITADGDHEVTVVTATPFRSLLAFLAHYSAIVLGAGAYDANGAVTTMVGSGPYRLTGVNAPLSLDAERFPQWWGTQPAIERVSFLSVSRGETRAAMAESGQADLVFTLAPETAARLKRNAGLSVTVHPIPRVRMLKLNAGSPYFRDLAVRQAVSLAIDREGVAAGLLRSPTSAASQLFPPTLADWHQGGLPPLQHDPVKAAALLSAAGWVPGPDGIRVKDGEPFRVTLRTFSDRPELPPLATALQEQFRRVGLDVKIAITSSGEIPAGHRDGTLQMALAARNFSLVPDPLGTLLQDFGPEGGDWGAMGWKNDGLIEALNALSREADPAARAALRLRVAETLQSELPVIPVAWYDYVVAANKRVAGVEVDPLELSYNIERMRWAD